MDYESEVDYKRGDELNGTWTHIANYKQIKCRVERNRHKLILVLP